MSYETSWSGLMKALKDIVAGISGLSGGGGSATATNQQTQITRETEIRDRLPAALVGGRLASDVTGTVAISNSSIEIANDVGNPVPVNGTVAVSNTEFLAYLEAIYNSTLPTITNGNKANLQLSSRGELLVSFIDFISSTGNITAADVLTVSTPGADNQSIFSGAPTANSFIAAAVTGDSSFAIQVDGTFVGTLQFERSLDGGSTYTAISAFAAGTAYTRSTTTQIGRWHGNCSSSNSIRVRATAWTSGTANIRILAGAGTGTITIGNPIRLFDQVTGVQASIKGANVAGLGADTAIVTTSRFNQFAAETQLTAPGTTQALDVTPYTRVNCQYVIASINTNVVVRLEGSNDGTNWSNLAQGEVDTTRTANGTFNFITTAPLYRVRFNFVSESGGTTATIDVRFTAN